MPYRRLLLIVAALALPELIVVAIEPLSPLRWVTKPLPMLALIAWYGRERQQAHAPQGGLVLLALVLSLVGDLLLLNNGQLFFMAGLGTFLVAHVCYVISFWRQRGPGDSLVANPMRLMAVFAVLGVAGYMLFQVMQAALRERQLFGPVAAYVAVISAMVITALHRRGGVPELSHRLVLVGALLFFLSDALLALSLFVQPFALSGLWIMSTYYAAQALITVGYRRSF